MLEIADERVDRLAEKLATLNHSSKTEAVRVALENELARFEAAHTLAEKIQPILDRLDKMPRTGLSADKAFYDELSGDI